MITNYFPKFSLRHVKQSIAIVIISLFLILSFFIFFKMIGFFEIYTEIIELGKKILVLFDLPNVIEVFLLYSVILFLLRKWWLLFWNAYENIAEAVYSSLCKLLLTKNWIGCLVNIIKFNHMIHKPIVLFFTKRNHFLTSNLFYREKLSKSLKSSIKLIVLK